MVIFVVFLGLVREIVFFNDIGVILKMSVLELS